MKTYLKKQLPISSFIYLGQIICGYIGGWISPIIPRLQDPEQTTLPEPITDTEASLLGSFINLGVLFGSLFAGLFAHNYGRKTCMIVSSGVVVISQIIMVTSVNLVIMIAGRMVAGFGLGAIFNTILVYLSEIASTNIRGIFLTGTGFFTSLGTLLAFCVIPYVPIPASLYIGMGMAIIFGVGMIFVPESPVFKILQGKEDEAKQILESLGRNDEFKDVIRLKVKEIEDKKPNYMELFTEKSNRKALFILIALYIFQSMSGATAMIAYATSIFNLANMNLDPNISTIVVGVTLLVSSCVSPMLVEYAGRRILLIASSGFSCICQAVMGLYFFLDDRSYPAVDSLRWLPLLTMMCFFLAFNSGLAIIPATLVGEMFASEVRSLGSAVTLCCNWRFVFVSSVTYGYLISALGGYITFWMYSGFCCGWVCSLSYIRTGD